MGQNHHGAACTLSECFAQVGMPLGRERLAQYLATRPYPHYEPAEHLGLLMRLDADGTRTVGRFVNRRFTPVSAR